MRGSIATDPVFLGSGFLTGPDCSMLVRDGGAARSEGSRPQVLQEGKCWTEAGFWGCLAHPGSCPPEAPQGNGRVPPSCPSQNGVSFPDCSVSPAPSGPRDLEKGEGVRTLHGPGGGCACNTSLEPGLSQDCPPPQPTRKPSDFRSAQIPSAHGGEP